MKRDTNGAVEILGDFCGTASLRDHISAVMCLCAQIHVLTEHLLFLACVFSFASVGENVLASDTDL